MQLAVFAVWRKIAYAQSSALQVDTKINLDKSPVKHVLLDFFKTYLKNHRAKHVFLDCIKIKTINQIVKTTVVQDLTSTLPKQNVLNVRRECFKIKIINQTAEYAQEESSQGIVKLQFASTARLDNLMETKVL